MKKRILMGMAALAVLLAFTGCGGNTAQPPEPAQPTANIETAAPETDFVSAGIRDNEIYYSSPETDYYYAKLEVSDEDAAEIISTLNADLTQLNADAEAKRAEIEASNDENKDYAEEIGLDFDIQFNTAGCDIGIYGRDIVMLKYNLATSRRLEESASKHIYDIIKPYADKIIGDEKAVNEGSDISTLTGIDGNTLNYTTSDYDKAPKTAVLSDDEAKEIVDIINSAPKTRGTAASIDNLWFKNGDTDVYMDTYGEESAYVNITNGITTCAELTKEQKNRINEIILTKTGDDLSKYSENTQKAE